MKIVDVVVEAFQYKSMTVRDSEGHGHPGPEHDATQSLLRIITDEGIEGYCFGANKNVIDHTVKPILIGADPFYREKSGKSCANGSGSPAAMANCSMTRSNPVTSSVTGCSTCKRVFISRK